MKVIGKDRTSCDVCNPIDEILARLDALERRASAIVAKVQGIAPDGEGNVTLPTSSSDTDPLHGRIDAFAMSSEVKEAADDAHAYAASIADDVVVINSEIDALNQAVAALQPAEIEAIKVAVETLQTTVATLESTVAALGNNVSERVSKSGDTMTGELITMRSGWNVRTYKSTDIDATALTTADSRPYMLRVLDKNDKVLGYDIIFAFSDRVMRQLKTNYYNSDGTVAGSSTLEIRADSDGSGYVQHPSWKVGTNDNSDKSLTIKMANSLPSLVHTTGNESIAGVKTFTNDMWLYMSNPKIFTRDTNGDFSKAPSETTTPFYIQCYDKNGLGYGNILSMYHDTSDNLIFNFGVDARHWKSGLQVVSSRSGDIFATASSWSPGTNDNSDKILTIKMANSLPSLMHTTGNETINGIKTFNTSPIVPTTPSSATGPEIATANWVISRINELATKNGLNGL